MRVENERRLVTFEDFLRDHVEASERGEPSRGPLGYLAQHALFEQIPATGRRRLWYVALGGGTRFRFEF